MALSDWYKFHIAAKLGGEGYGMTYEYVAKYRLLRRFEEKQMGNYSGMLILGIPQKYGVSLDFLLWVEKLGVKEILVWLSRSEVNVREIYMDMCRKLGEYIPQVRDINLSFVLSLQDLEDKDFSDWICVSCEVFQGLDEEKRAIFSEIAKSCKRYYIFVPNDFNRSHVTISKLPTVEGNDFYCYFGVGQKIFGYIDIPPVPPGFVINKNKNQQEELDAITCRLIDKLIYTVLNLWLVFIDELMLQKIPFLCKRMAHIFWLGGI